MNKVHEISEHELYRKLKELNPETPIFCDLTKTYLIFTIEGSKEDLILPEGFYHAHGNRITNKHKTRTGFYIDAYLEEVKLISNLKVFDAIKGAFNNLKPNKNKEKKLKK